MSKINQDTTNKELEGDIRLPSRCFKQMNMEPNSPEAARVISSLLSRFYDTSKVCAHHARHEIEGFVIELNENEANEVFHYSLVSPKVCSHQRD